MAKKKIEEVKHRCRDCVYCEADETNLSLLDRSPILGRCKYKEFMFLLRSNSCNKFKQK